MNADLFPLLLNATASSIKPAQLPVSLSSAQTNDFSVRNFSWTIAAKVVGRLRWSSWYMLNARAIWRRLPTETLWRALRLAVLRADESKVASTAIMATTVRSSINVNPHGRAAFFAFFPKIFKSLSALHGHLQDA